MTKTIIILYVLAILCAMSSARKDEVLASSVTYNEIPEGVKAGIQRFFLNIQEQRKRDALTGVDNMKPNLRSEAIPNQPLPLPAGYKEHIPQVPVPKEYLEKEIFINNQKCEVSYEKYMKPTIYMSHLWGADTCYLSTFTTNIQDSSTYVYAKATYENVLDATEGDAFAVTVRLYKDAGCSEEATGESYSAFHDTLAKQCTLGAAGKSEQSQLYTVAPGRNLKISERGTSVSLFSSIDDCVTGTGTLQERLSREDNCYNGVKFECFHSDRFEPYSYLMTKYPSPDCTETLEDGAKSQIVSTKFTRAEGCQMFMPLDATYGHPVINCGQHW